MKKNIQDVLWCEPHTIKPKSKRPIAKSSIGTSHLIVLLSEDGCTINELYYKINYDEVIDTLVKEGIDKLYADFCIGGEMPVIIENGFGGVIFHEACGHAMEATSVADGISVLSHDLNKKIASEVVNIVDDGTLKNEWGSTRLDDEGRETKRNVLIKDGVLKGFLIDEVNSRKMGMAPTGSSRRESYLYAPTSRMNNTYLEAGNSKFQDMIKDIKLGLYAKKMGGGCVSPETGDFNFACDLAYMIRDGKVCECVKSASLIGNCKDILQSVEMVGDNLELGQGMCGSVSGYVPVNVGMPHCPKCHRPVAKQTVDQMVDKLKEELQLGEKIMVLAPVIRGQKGEHIKVLDVIRKSGFSRVDIDGNIYTLDEDITLDKNKKHSISVVVDRIVMKDDIEKRLK